MSDDVWQQFDRMRQSIGANTHISRELADALTEGFNRLKDERDVLAAHAERLNAKLEDFDKCLYGEGLMVANHHLNGDLEPMDNWFDENDWSPEYDPATSLARRDAEKQLKGAEAYKEALKDATNPIIWPHIEGAFEVWRNAHGEQADTAREGE
ncbi:hypothetical protein ACGTNG_12815 [Halomonas sp. 1390]|uniref:hypothetical protein n=1 Tax=Halomonas sp. B23F22_3 TaxID=3459516 RepID=UPI00373F238C